MSLKILTVFGTRPEVIKLAPFIQAVKQDGTCVSLTCATTQHRALQNDVMSLFGIDAEYDLNIMINNQDLFYISEKILERMKSVLQQEKPHWTVVQGDTTTALMSALASFYAGIPIVHIEAGLRTWNNASPFPEEANRSLIAKIATLHMAPTAEAVQNLNQEGIFDNVFHVGNTIVDAVDRALNLNIASVARNKELEDLLESPMRKILVTVHRRENFGKPLINICQAISELASQYSDTLFLWPVHPNPNVSSAIDQYLSKVSNIHLLSPMSYHYLLKVINQCELIMTDSGGLQEEASIFGKSVIVLREETERVEIIKSGIGHLVGACQEKIVSLTHELLNQKNSKFFDKHNLYGLPGVSKKILDIIKEKSHA